MNGKEAAAALDDLKKGVMLTGRLSEVHVKNLKNYPFIFFEELKSVEMSYNIVTDPTVSAPGTGSFVRYKLDVDVEKNLSYMEKRLQALKGSVQTLLWPSVQVIVVDQTERELK